jgi:hypothetical protein
MDGDNGVEETSPLCIMFALRKELGEAVAQGKWKTAHNRAKALFELIPKVEKQTRIKFGKPHFSGLYMIGTDHLRGASEKSKESILRFNHELAKAKERVERMK